MIQSEWQTLESLLAQLTAGETRELIERLQLSLRAGDATVEVPRQSSEWADLLGELESLPVEGPRDGFSGSDHDRLLYGRQA